MFILSYLGNALPEAPGLREGKGSREQGEMKKESFQTRRKWAQCHRNRKMEAAARNALKEAVENLKL